MKRKTLRNFFRLSLTFSVSILYVVLQPSCSLKRVRDVTASSESISLKKLQLQYGAYDFNIATKFIKGKIHLNYINRNNYWEFGVWNGDSINVVKFNGAFYKKVGEQWKLYASYDNFDLPDYLKLVLPDENITPGNVIKFKPNPVIVRSKNASGKIRTNGNKFYNLKIDGSGYNAHLTLMRMLPILPDYFQTTISVTGLSLDDSKILYRRIKELHPMIYESKDTTIIKIQGYISRKLFRILSGKGEISIFPVSYAPTPDCKMINLDNNEKLFYKEEKQKFKIRNFKTDENNIIVELITPADPKRVYGLFIDNNFVGIGKADGMKIRFVGYVNNISSYIKPLISNGYITSKLTVINFIEPYNRRQI